MIFGINTTGDISKLLYEISLAVRRVKLETILKYHEWYLCQISRINHAIVTSTERSKGFATLRNVSKLTFFDKIGHAKSVGFYSAV